MATTARNRDNDAGKGMPLVAGALVGALVVGFALAALWRYQSAQDQSQVETSQYLSLGEQKALVGKNAVVVKFTIEYVGSETEKPLNKALPYLQRQVVKRLTELEKSDLPELHTLKGKQALANDILLQVREAVGSGKAARNVKGILFEKFLIKD